MFHNKIQKKCALAWAVLHYGCKLAFHGWMEDVWALWAQQSFSRVSSGWSNSQVSFKALRKSTVKCFEHWNTLYTPSSGLVGITCSDMYAGDGVCLLIAHSQVRNSVIFITADIKHKRIVKVCSDDSRL